jgi:hypothetical protein
MEHNFEQLKAHILPLSKANNFEIARARMGDAASVRVGTFNFVKEGAPRRIAHVLIIEHCPRRIDVRVPAMSERPPWDFYLDVPSNLTVH